MQQQQCRQYPPSPSEPQTRRRWWPSPPTLPHVRSRRWPYVDVGGRGAKWRRKINRPSQTGSACPLYSMRHRHRRQRLRRTVGLVSLYSMRRRPSRTMRRRNCVDEDGGAASRLTTKVTWEMKTGLQELRRGRKSPRSTHESKLKLVEGGGFLVRRCWLRSQPPRESWTVHVRVARVISGQQPTLRERVHMTIRRLALCPHLLLRRRRRNGAAVGSEDA